MKYTKPGARPTMRGIQTGHPSAADTMNMSVLLIIFKAILDSENRN